MSACDRLPVFGFLGGGWRRNRRNCVIVIILDVDKHEVMKYTDDCAREQTSTGMKGNSGQFFVSWSILGQFLCSMIRWWCSHFWCCYLLNRSQREL